MAAIARCSGAAAVAALALLVGCSSEDDAASQCQLVATAHGVSVTVAADVAPVSKLILQVCVDDQCSHQPVDLRPGTSSVDQGCTGSGPDAQCSAELSPDGTQVGFVPAELPEGPVRVGGRYVVGGRAVELADSTVQVTTSYPNGPACGADGTQATVVLDRTGLH